MDECGCLRVGRVFLRFTRGAGTNVDREEKMMTRYLMAVLLAVTLGSSGCSKEFWGGGAAGVLGTGAAYEIQTKRQMDQLEEDYRSGKITKEEYEIRKDQIRKGSIFY